MAVAPEAWGCRRKIAGQSCPPAAQARGMTLPDPSTFIAEGASAAVYRLDGGRGLKLFHEGVDPSIIRREYVTAEMIQATGLPAARLFGRCEAGGRQGIIYSEIEGPNLLHYIWRHPHRVGWAMREMAQLQAHIHRQPVPMLRSRKAILTEDIEMAPIGARLRAAAIDRLDQLGEGDMLSHGDLHPANLIVSGEGLVAIRLVEGGAGDAGGRCGAQRDADALWSGTSQWLAGGAGPRSGHGPLCPLLPPGRDDGWRGAGRLAGAGWPVLDAPSSAGPRCGLWRLSGSRTGTGGVARAGRLIAGRMSLVGRGGQLVQWPCHRAEAMGRSSNGPLRPPTCRYSDIETGQRAAR